MDAPLVEGEDSNLYDVSTFQGESQIRQRTNPRIITLLKSGVPLKRDSPREADVVRLYFLVLVIACDRKVGL
jgi:hypothetical protein